jgi:hypothetical protein
LRLERFLTPGQVDPVLHAGRSLYLVPDGPAADPGYAVLTAALVQRGRWALGRMVLGGHRQVVLVRPVPGVWGLAAIRIREEGAAPSPHSCLTAIWRRSAEDNFNWACRILVAYKHDYRAPSLPSLTDHSFHSPFPAAESHDGAASALEQEPFEIAKVVVDEPGNLAQKLQAPLARSFAAPTPVRWKCSRARRRNRRGVASHT